MSDDIDTGGLAFSLLKPADLETGRYFFDPPPPRRPNGWACYLCLFDVTSGMNSYRVGFSVTVGAIEADGTRRITYSDDRGGRQQHVLGGPACQARADRRKR